MVGGGGHCVLQTQPISFRPWSHACIDKYTSKSHTIRNLLFFLQEAINLLMNIPRLSIPGGLLLATAIIQRTDLEAIERSDDSVIFTERTMENYLQAQEIIINQV